MLRLPVEIGHFRVEAKWLLEVAQRPDCPEYPSAVARGRASLHLLMPRVELLAHSVPDQRPRWAGMHALAQARRALDRTPHTERAQERSEYARRLAEAMRLLCGQLRSLATAWIPAYAPGIVPAGCFWDAVRVTRRTGAELLTLLGDETGAVIADQRYGAMYWLTPPDTGTALCLPGNLARIRSTGHHVVIPPLQPRNESLVQWEVRHEGLSGWGWLTEPAQLRRALNAIAQERPIGDSDARR
ncbi:DUF6415 family natural product biosynthesis protein [Streptomyces sp. NPDC050560]|uniref:DUF6415 family natural product biosynthesis protein n=1 Tax=Streptomyces sp. NPDC050560 TaxID=3365630 RepID=UPI0037886BAD